MSSQRVFNKRSGEVDALAKQLQEKIRKTMVLPSKKCFFRCCFPRFVAVTGWFGP